MDMFTYTLKIKEIDTLKTLKSKDEMIRSLISQFSRVYSEYSLDTKVDIITSDTLLYKCVTKLLLVYDKNRLPDHIIKRIDTIHMALVTRYCTHKSTYELFIDTFQYVKTVTIANGSPAKIQIIAETIRDNIPPFTIIYNEYPDAKFSYLVVDKDSTLHKSLSTIMQLEEIKYKLPNCIRYTTIEELLTKHYAIAATRPCSEAAADNIINDIANLTRNATIIKARLLGV